MKTEVEILAEADAYFRAGDLQSAFAVIIRAMKDYQTPAAETWGFTAGMPQLDRFCSKVGRSLLGKSRGEKRHKEKPLDVYLASEIYPTGGHTALLGDYAGNSPSREAHLLLSNVCNRENPAVAAASIRTTIADENIEVCPFNDFVEKTRWMIRRLQELQPDRIFIFNHPQDPIPVAAAQPKLARWIYFVHHADHTPALGLYLRQARHFDLTPRAFHCCSRLLGVRKALYLPLQCHDRGAKSGEAVDRPLHTASSGSRGKFNLRGPDSYPGVITRLLAATNIRHFHIGPLPEWVIRRWRERLREKNIAEERLVLLPSVPSVWQAMRDYQIDVYIHSFPNPGARVAVEVMGSGTPILQYSKTQNGLQSTINLVYPESASWSVPQELVRLVKRATPQWIGKQRKLARAHFERFHARELIAPVFQSDPMVSPVALKIDPSILALYRKQIATYRKKINLPRWLTYLPASLARSLTKQA